MIVSDSSCGAVNLRGVRRLSAGRPELREQTQARLEWLADESLAQWGTIAAFFEKLPEASGLLITVKIALEFRDGRRATREASRAISAARDWRQTARDHVSFETLRKRRGLA